MFEKFEQTKQNLNLRSAYQSCFMEHELSFKVKECLERLQSLQENAKNKTQQE